MAFVSDTRMVANCWLRPGNSHTANNVRAFLDEALDKLGGKRVALLRADSGFCDHANTGMTTDGRGRLGEDRPDHECGRGRQSSKPHQCSHHDNSKYHLCPTLPENLMTQGMQLGQEVIQSDRKQK